MKQVKENFSGGGSVQGVAGAKKKSDHLKHGKPFAETKIKGTVKSGAVFSPKKKSTISKGKDSKKEPYTLVQMEEEEQKLREAIRELILLNRIKYHEDNVKKELQEQKIRRVIRFLLKESDNTRDINFDTTGAASAWSYIQNIEKTTFENDFANSLKTTKEQRDAFKIVYLTGVKIYLDSLDQQYLIMHPEEKPGASAPAPASPAPDATGLETAPAKRRDLSEEDVAGNPHPAAAPAAQPADKPMDTKYMQTQAVQSAATQGQKLDRTGRDRAESALKRDLPQIDPLYFNLTFKSVTTGSGRQTSDRQEFRYFLIGDKSRVGNLQLKFKEWGDKLPIGGQASPENIPKTDPDNLNLGDIGGAGAAPGGDLGGDLGTPDLGGADTGAEGGSELPDLGL